MHFSDGGGHHAQDIADLTKAAFIAAYGATEGGAIGDLAGKLLHDTVSEDLFVFTAEDDGSLLGAIFFSRLRYPDEPRQVFVLGPVAVATDHQKTGIGGALIAHGLQQLRAAGIDIALTYGDPAFYAKVGFAPLTERFAAAPFRLSQPHGWMGQSLTSAAMTPLKGPPTCVSAFNDPAFW